VIIEGRWWVNQTYFNNCLSYSKLSDELITHPGDSYRLWWVVLYDLGTSWMRRPWPTGGCRAIKQTNTKLKYPVQLVNCKVIVWMRYEGCQKSIRPVWIFREPVVWPWYKLAASQRRPYCTSVNSHSPVRLISQQWDAVDWACVVCDRHSHKSPPFQRRFYLWEKPNLVCKGAGRPGWFDALPKKAGTRAV